MAKERRLGRGLEALLGSAPESAETSPAGTGTALAETPRSMGNALPAPQSNPQNQGSAGGSNSATPLISVEKVRPNPFQPRREFDRKALEQLAESIDSNGLLQPIVVRKKTDGYEIIAGERRWRACKQLGWEEIPATVKSIDDRQMAEQAIIENLQRQDLNALEKAAAFKNYLKEYRCPQSELAKRVGIDRSTVANLIRLLELPEVVQQAVAEDSISAGHARALLPLGEEKAQIKFCKRIQNEGWSVRVTEQAVKELIEEADREVLAEKADEKQPNLEQRTRAEHLASLAENFRVALGTKVEVRQGAKETGRIVIHFTTEKEFSRLRELLLQPTHKIQEALEAEQAETASTE
ncbi:Plasmid partitioning protein ParB [Planctomycetales bacterium 10988]|nr:Plasmid partitioning protein ParB [Planctomycetales bacterium 10988]